MFFLLKTHHHQVVATRALRPTLVQLRTRLRNPLLRQKAQIGYNLAGLQYIKRNEDLKTSEFYTSLEDETQVREKLAAMEKKRKRVHIKA